MNRCIARRVAALLVVLFMIALPAAAQTDHEPRANLARIVTALWERLSAPLVSLWEKGRSVIDPDGVTAPTTQGDTGDGRGMIDPDG